MPCLKLPINTLEKADKYIMPDKSSLPSYLETLNSEQQQAVLHTGKSLLILAGAGSGKTRVITTKIAWLIREHGIPAQSILAVTFTNKAAHEMAERAKIIDHRAEYAMLRTFHSYGAWFLRRYGAYAGLESNFLIYDDNDVISLLSTMLKDFKKQDIKHIAHNISRAKDYFFSPEDPLLKIIDNSKKFRSIYSQYEERLLRTGNADFGDLIKKPVEILRKEPELAQRVRERFSVIMVDEYQDANVAQFELLKELAGPQTYVCVVGDDDQSIYRFRGAEVKNILEFPQKFPGTEIIRLGSNYRSTKAILDTASSVVAHNKGRLGKILHSERGEGKKPVLAFLPNQDEEIDYCATLIKNSVSANKGQFSEWAVLYRTNAQSLGFETEFLHRNIPYRVVGSLKFYEREEIKDALALLSFMVNPNDEVAFRRVVNKPARALGLVTVNRLVEASLQQGINIFDAAKKTAPEITPKGRKGLEEFLAVMEKCQSLLKNSVTENNKITEKNAVGKINNKSFKKRNGELVSGEGLSLCVAKIVKDSGIAGYHLTQDDISGNQRLENLQELVNAASLYPCTVQGLLEFLEHIELDRAREENSKKGSTDDAENHNRVTLITYHNTKGLEFKRVIMTGLEQGLFPREDKKGDDLEEERRLFYVGATRAMDELYLCSCEMRRIFGRIMPMNPSVFLREIDKNCIRIIGNAPLGFNVQNFRSFPFTKKQYSVKELEAEDSSFWHFGDRLYHDDYGCGYVQDVSPSGEGPVVKVLFETGFEWRFLSDHQSGAIVKLENDD